MASITTQRIARESINWSIGLSVVIILGGLLALAVPFTTGLAATTILAWILLILGLLHLWLAWHTRGTGVLLWEVMVGACYLFAGGVVLAHPLAGLVALTLVLGSYLLVKGVAEIIAGVNTRGVGGSGWLLLDGIISVVLSAMIWLHLPSAATWVIGTLIGFSILFSGITFSHLGGCTQGFRRGLNDARRALLKEFGLQLEFEGANISMFPRTPAFPASSVDLIGLVPGQAPR